MYTNITHWSFFQEGDSLFVGGIPQLELPDSDSEEDSDQSDSEKQSDGPMDINDLKDVTPREQNVDKLDKSMFVINMMTVSLIAYVLHMHVILEKTNGCYFIVGKNLMDVISL